MIRSMFFILVIASVLLQCGANHDEVSSPPFYDVTAPDGSKHYMLGTMHIGVGLADLSQEVITAFAAADIYVGEMTTEAMMRKLQEEEKSNAPTGHSLASKLGEQYWLALRQQLPAVSEEKLDRMTVEDVSTKMLELVATNTEEEKLALDLQINLFGEYSGKRMIGLDEHIPPRLLREAILALIGDINDLKKAILCGGVPCLQTKIADMRTAWLQGDLDQLDKIVTEGGRMKKFIRDQAWFDSGIVQNKCKHGQTCLIYVGAAHLFDYPDSFATILRQNGYQIEKHRL